jgi:hypothetical protein
MKLRPWVSLVFMSARVWGADSVPHDQPYYTHDSDGVQLIYTEKNLPAAQRAAALEDYLHPLYENLFGFALDETLYVGLMSDYNQIANGYSTQLPNNRQINFIGGTERVDYFSVASWLDVLIFHETAHNYQLNAKDNAISQSLHTVLGNGGFINPLFTLPNFAVNPFILEGNAVLNESTHGNGGRLYSGRFLAQTLLQVKAGHFTPARMHNDTLFFPYGEHYYTMGGFFQYYLAEKYGLQKTNRFMKENSQDWFWPFFTNNALERAVGRDFETSMDDFVKDKHPLAAQVVEARGEWIAHSQYFSSLNRDEGSVFFLVNEDGVRAPERVVVDRKSKKVDRRRESYQMGKLIKTRGRFFTQGGRSVSPLRMYQGLFDNRAIILPGTEGKMVQGYLRDGREVYFDVSLSFDHPRLFVGNDHVADVHSSVLIDRQDNLYYFIQTNKTRTLYKNKTPLYSYQGYYGIVSDVDDEGRVYFVANSPVGSTLYRLNAKNTVERVSDADNIVEARLVSNNEVMVAATGADGYYYVLNPLTGKNETPFETTLFFEKKPPFLGPEKKAPLSGKSIGLKNRYHSLLDIHYSGTLVNLQSDPDAGWLYDVQVAFADPLTQNVVTALASRTSDEVTVVGAGYENTQTLVQLKALPFAVTEKNAELPSSTYRDFGVIGLASLPFLKRGYWEGTVIGTYSQDYEAVEREPLGVSLVFSRSEHHGHSFYRNSVFDTTLFGISDRGDSGYGGALAVQRDFPKEWYLSLGAKSSRSDRDRNNATERRGVKMMSKKSLVDLDPSVITMPSVDGTRYVKKVVKGSVGIKKVLNFSKYYFTFPISLRRESLYLSYDRYDIDNYNESHIVNEMTAGVTLDALWLNSFPVPLNLEYINNDNPSFGDRNNFRMYFSLDF